MMKTHEAIRSQYKDAWEMVLAVAIKKTGSEVFDTEFLDTLPLSPELREFAKGVDGPPVETLTTLAYQSRISGLPFRNAPPDDYEQVVLAQCESCGIDGRKWWNLILAERPYCTMRNYSDIGVDLVDLDFSFTWNATPENWEMLFLQKCHENGFDGESLLEEIEERTKELGYKGRIVDISDGVRDAIIEITDDQRKAGGLMSSLVGVANKIIEKHPGESLYKDFRMSGVELWIAKNGEGCFTVMYPEEYEP